MDQVGDHRVLADQRREGDLVEHIARLNLRASGEVHRDNFGSGVTHSGHHCRSDCAGGAGDHDSASCQLLDAHER